MENVSKFTEITLMVISFQTDLEVWANSADPDQTAPTVCNSICIFLKKYPQVWPLCLGFR